MYCKGTGKYKSKLPILVEGDLTAPLSIVTTLICDGGANPFPGLLHFNLDMYFIMLSVKQGGIKYHFLLLWYDSTWDWTPVSQTTGEHYLLGQWPGPLARSTGLVVRVFAKGPGDQGSIPSWVIPSSSCCAASMDLPDPLQPPFSIVHRFC